jgi:hypothetical protein
LALNRRYDKTKKKMSLCGKKNTGGPIFGEPLDVAAERSDPFKLVPYVLRASFGYLNKRGSIFSV